MKNFPYITYFLIFIIITSFSVVAFANEEQYKKYFKIGLEFYKDKNFEDADLYLRKSFELKKHSKTAYFIADSNLELEEYVTAKTYANFALSKLKPILQRDKQKYLMRIISKIDERAIRNYKRVKTTTKYNLTLSKNEKQSLDLAKLKAIEDNSKRQVQRAKEELIALGINPDKIDNAFIIPDKCDSNYARNRTPEEVSNCLAERFH